MRWSDLRAALLVFVREQAARLQGRAATARTVFSCWQRRPRAVTFRAVTFSPFIAATERSKLSLLPQQSLPQLNDPPTSQRINKSYGYRAPGGSPGFFINNFESTLCWLRGGAIPGVNFQLAPALSSSLALPSLQRLAGWWLFHMCFPEGFSPPSSASEHSEGLQKTPLWYARRGFLSLLGAYTPWIWMVVYLNTDNQEVRPGTAEMPLSWGSNWGIPKIQQLCKAGPRTGHILALSICSSSIAASRWGTAEQGMPTTNFVTKTSPDFVQAANCNIRTHNYSPAHSWAQLKFLFGRGQREMFSWPIFLRD